MKRTLGYVMLGLLLATAVAALGSMNGCAAEELPALDATTGAAGSVGVVTEALAIDDANSPCY